MLICRLRHVKTPRMLGLAAISIMTGSMSNGLSATHPPARPATLFPQLVKRQNTWAPERCMFNSIMIGADGRILVSEDPHPAFVRSLALRTMSEFMILDETDRTNFLVDGDASAITWNAAADQIEMIVNGRTWLQFDPREGRTVAADERPQWRWVEVKAVRWDALKLLTRDAAIISAIEQPLPGRSRIFQTAYVGSRIAFRFMFPESGDRIWSLTGTSTHPSAFMSSWWDGLFPDHKIGAHLDTEAFGRPFFVPSDGRLAGTFSPDVALIGDSGATAIQPPHGAGLIKAVSTLGRLTVLLTAQPDGTHWVSRIRKEAVQTIRLCGPMRTRDDTQQSVVVRHFADEHFPALLHRARAERASKVLIVRFHGGPFASVLDQYPSPTAQALHGLGFDILEPDYPSSRQADQDRTPVMSPTTITAYNDALISWASHAGYAAVIVVGESLGALPAADLALRYPGLVASPLLIAPLTRLDEGRTLDGRAVTADHIQSRAEAKAFGAGNQRADLEIWVDRMFEGLCTRGDAVVYVGSADTIAGGERLRPCLRSHAIDLPGATHTSIVDNKPLWTSVREVIVMNATPKRRQRDSLSLDRTFGALR